MWGLFRLFEERGRKDFTIGTDPTATFQIDNGLPMPLAAAAVHGHRLRGAVHAADDRRSSREGDTMTTLAEAVQNGKARPSAMPGAYALPIANEARVNLRLGDATFNMVSTPKPRRLPVPLDDRLGRAGLHRGDLCRDGASSC